MDAIEALKTRRSIRSFRPDPISEEILRELVDCARLAPSGNNVQPWEFIVVRDSKMRRALADLAEHGRFIAEAPACIVVAARETKYYLEDGSAATQNLLVAAHALGLGACWVAGDKKPYAERVLSLLGVPKGYKLVSMVAVGLPAEGQPLRSSKRSLAEVLHWEHF